VIVQYCELYDFAKPVNKLYAFGNNIEEQIANINSLFSNTDDEGSVIQFEKIGKNGQKTIVGRIKAKTDTYPQLLKLMNNCNYESISSLILNDLQRFKNWEQFELYLKGLGNANYPEELMGSYEKYHQEFWEHRDNCTKFFEKINKDLSEILDKSKIKFEFGDNFEVILDKKARAEFADHAKRHPFPGALFACLDAKLNTQYTYDRLLRTPEEARIALEKLSCR
jgi:hypothetical protein